MTAKTNHAETETLDYLLSFVSHIQFHNGDPGEAATSNVIASTGWSRQAITFGGASGDTASNATTGEITSGADDVTVTHWSLWDASSSGNAYYKGAVTTPRTYDTGEKLTWGAGDFDVTES